MAARSRIEPIDRDVALIIDECLSPEAQSRFLADAAREALADAEAQNAGVIGRTPEHESFVDGQQTADLDRVRPTGTIVFEFRLIEPLLVWIGEMLVQRAPFRTGRFTASFALFADGTEISITEPAPAAREYVFLSLAPYARKIEKGLSPQAPDGLMEGIAVMAQRRFGNQAQVRYGFRSAPHGELGRWAQTPSARSMAERVRGGRPDRHTEWLTRQPAIVVIPM